jgi:hypothetical protein
MSLSDRRWDRLAVAAIGVGAVARGIWIFWLHKPLDYVYSDMSTYLAGARQIADWHGLGADTTFQPQGLHLLLALPLLAAALAALPEYLRRRTPAPSVDGVVQPADS